MATQTFTTSRIGVSTNLTTGGTYDILLVSTPEYPVGALTFKFEATPRKISGIQKVAQLFLKVLFTQKGSDVIYPSHGTNFPNLLVGANRQSSDPEFLASITSSLQDAENQVKYIFNGADKDPSSVLSSMTVLGLQALKETLAIYLQLTTAAGETASIAVPFPELDLKISQ